MRAEAHAHVHCGHCGGCRRTAVLAKTLGHFSDRSSRVFEAAASHLANALPFNPKKNVRFIWYLEELKPGRKLKSVNLNILLNIYHIVSECFLSNQTKTHGPKPHVATLQGNDFDHSTFLCGKGRTSFQNASFQTKPKHPLEAACGNASSVNDFDHWISSLW